MPKCIICGLRFDREDMTPRDSCDSCHAKAVDEVRAVSQYHTETEGTWSGEVEFVHDGTVIEEKWKVIKIEQVGRDENGIQARLTLKRLGAKQ